MPVITPEPAPTECLPTEPTLPPAVVTFAAEPVRSDREESALPEIAPEPTEETPPAVELLPTSVPALGVKPAPVPTPAPSAAASGEPVPQGSQPPVEVAPSPEKESPPPQSPAAEATASPAEPERSPVEGKETPPALQVVLVVLGLIACGAVGMAVVHVGPFRKK